MKLSSRIVIFVCTVALAACSPATPAPDAQAPSSGSSVSSASSVSDGWTTYASPKGFTVSVPPSWKVDVWEDDAGISIYEPTKKVENEAPGDGSYRFDQDIYFRTGDIDAYITQLDASENGTCGEKQPAKVGIYDAQKVVCGSVMGAWDHEDYFLPKGDMFFHFASDIHERISDVSAKIRASFRMR